MSEAIGGHSHSHGHGHGQLEDVTVGIFPAQEGSEEIAFTEPLASRRR
ncbi:hypothetical protein GS429_10680 [Natronorubrum sp. JWXQ-INN-674]|uniref:Uncharacterized protein n=1 Tax=Natronorubrum halalkaliphilum TaxID=2691917 RepID=A0A6B0VM15_9EURY|nr:hypothetical protein [Natronorubrum halalkaliphilum]MXV62518.1 hypothetical protein [Natronorubrum halalkaliphilum]